MRTRYQQLLCLALTSVSAAGLTACGNGDENSSTDQSGPSAMVELSLTTVPASILCVRITATPSSGSATVRTWAVAAGSTTASLQIGPIAQGSYNITGDAFTTACSSISGAGSWIADSAPVVLRAGVTTSVALTFRQNSPLTVSANFVNNVRTMTLNAQNTYLATDGDGLLHAGYLANNQKFTRTNFSVFDSTTTAGNAIAVIAAATNGVCAARVDGTLWCWGSNTYGELGPGIPVNGSSTVPVQFAGLTNVSKLAAGSTHMCAYGYGPSAFGVYCWGFNGMGELGNGTTTNSQAPVMVSQGLPKSLACGLHSSYFVAYSGALAAWGNNAYGQLGNGNTTASLTPIPSLDTTVQSVTAGAYHACALRVDGTVRCFGQNVNGQLGIGNTTDAWTPTVIGGLYAKQIVAGAYHTCALTTVGQTLCWGHNFYGQLGDATDTTRNSPVATSLGVMLTSLFAGVRAQATCGIASTLDIYCWGNNYFSNLGGDGGTYQFLPAKAQLQ